MKITTDQRLSSLSDSEDKHESPQSLFEQAIGTPYVDNAYLSCRDVEVFYREQCAIRHINLDIAASEVLAIIGPSGCGKSTFLRCLNRMNDTISDCRVRGTITLDGEDIYAPGVDVVSLRSRVGMVFQKPNPFPKSIYDNVAYGARIHGLTENGVELDELVVTSLQRAGLWDEVKDRINSNAMALSSGQQQRLCIARTIAIDPEIILMDEPCSSLDPIATAKVETMINDLRQEYSIVIITHSQEQAARISQRTAYFQEGLLVEINDTEKIFTTPQSQQTEYFITGRYQ